MGYVRATVGGVVIGMKNAEIDAKIIGLMKKWILIGVGSVILMILTTLLIIYGKHSFVTKTISLILVVIQFSLIFIVIRYYLMLRKLRKQMVTE